jgi:hypothetical protein
MWDVLITVNYTCVLRLLKTIGVEELCIEIQRESLLKDALNEAKNQSLIQKKEF